MSKGIGGVDSLFIVAGVILALIFKLWWIFVIIIVLGLVLVAIVLVTTNTTKGTTDEQIKKTEIVHADANTHTKSHTKHQNLSNSESIEKVDKYVEQAKKHVSEPAKKVIIILQSYSGSYKNSESTDSIYDYITQKVDRRIDEISPDKKSIYVTLISLLQKIKTCDNNNEINIWLDTASRVFDNSHEKEDIYAIQDKPTVSDEQIEIITKKNIALSNRIRAFLFVAIKNKKQNTLELLDDVICIIAELNSRNSFLNPGDDLYEYFKQQISCELDSASGKNAKASYSTALQIIKKLNEGEDDSSILNWICDVHQNNGKNLDGKVYVPHWEHRYIYSKDDLQDATASQKIFYEQFKKAFLAGKWIDIEDNTNYAFVLLFDLGDMYNSKEDHQILSEQLNFLSVNCPKTQPYLREVLKKYDERILKKEAREMLDNIGESSIPTRWVSDGEEVIVAGTKLIRGNFYLGDCLIATGKNVLSRFWSSNIITKERFLGPVVNPDLEVEYVDNAPMCVFSSYTSLSKGQKYNYLRFLSGDVSFADVHPSFLELYLVGIEFRLFIDKQTTLSEQEALVKKLVEIYNIRWNVNNREDGYGYGSKQYLVNLLDRSVSMLRPNNPTELLGDFRIVSLPRYSKIILKDFRINTKDFSKEKVFEFAVEYFRVTRDIPAGEKNYNAVKKRFLDCFSGSLSYLSNSVFARDNNDVEITEYLAHIYDEYLHIDANNVCYHIKYPYSNADDSISYEIQNASNRIYWDNYKRRELIEANHGKTTAYADMNYAPYLDPSAEPSLIDLANKIDSFADSTGFTNIPVKQFVQWITYPPRNEKGIYKPYAETITNALFKMGYGIAPNPKVERDRLMHDGFCCLYKLADRKGFSDEIYKGQIIVKMACQVALSDTLLDNDIKLLSESLKSFGYNGNTFLYLIAFAKQFSSVKQFYIVNNLNKFTSAEISAIYNLLLRLTFNSGNVSSERVKTLKRYCKLLGQDSEKIHSNIHSAMTDDEFATVEKTTGTVKYSIPKPDDVKQKFAIDTVKLERIQQQTNEAQELLSNIFVDDKPEEKHSNVQQTDFVKAILQKLFEKPVWQFSEIDELCKEYGQMIGFVLEKINDYSYQKVDDIVVEQDGEMIYVTVDYKDTLI